MVCSASMRAHPRSRGENPAHLGELAGAGGSSPLTRGKHLWVASRVGGMGLIPAHAGKTIAWLIGYLIAWAHPRSRGENAQASATASAWSGSSPLTRGKRISEPTFVRDLGLIPAHAGKTCRLRGGFGTAVAHPRSRGENLVRPGRCSAHAGSSPLTRGKPSSRCDRTPP